VALELIKDAKEAEEGKSTFELTPDLELPMLIKYRDPTVDQVADETLKFKMDVESRPDPS